MCGLFISIFLFKFCLILLWDREFLELGVGGFLFVWIFMFFVLNFYVFGEVIRVFFWRNWS